MQDAKNGGTAGFSLVEVLTAITVLGLMLAPIGASLVMSHRLNARSQQLMEDQLAVSNAVETLMAEGIDKDDIDGSGLYQKDKWEPVEIKACQRSVDLEGSSEKPIAAYQVTVTSGDVEVETYIRPAPPEASEGGEEGGDGDG